VHRAILALACGAVLLAGCARGAEGSSAGAGRLKVVAAESPWGAVVAAIGGDHVSVTSLLWAPGADPHEYQPTASAAAAVATARVVVMNGLGYDRYMARMLAQGSLHPQRVVEAAKVLHVEGPQANPHLWYDVARVPRVATAIERSLVAADPRHAADYRAGLAAFTRSLDPDLAALAEIRMAHRSDPVLVTERVADYLLAEAGLTIVSPESFARAVESGQSPSAAATASMGALLRPGRAAALVVNSTVDTPATSAVRRQARASGVPVVLMTETVQPPGLGFAAWQGRQIRALSAALEGSR
jgi:zinc/manganese transport system substrate-binding protein